MQEISQYLNEYIKHQSEMKEIIAWTPENYCNYCCEYIDGLLYSMSHKNICDRCITILSHISHSDFVIFPYLAFVPQKNDSPQRLAIVRLKYLQQLEAKMKDAKAMELDTNRLEYFIMLINAIPPNHRILSYLSIKIPEVCALYDFDNTLYYAMYGLTEESLSINLISKNTRRFVLSDLDIKNVQTQAVIRFKKYIKEYGI